MDKKLPFYKYQSIENHYSNKHINDWVTFNPEMETMKYVLQEKIDGSNFQIYIDNDLDFYDSWFVFLCTYDVVVYYDYWYSSCIYWSPSIYGNV